MDAVHAATDKEIARLQRRIKPIYEQAEKQVDAELQEWAKTVKETVEKLLKAIKDAKTDAELKAAKAAYKQFFIRSVKKDKRFIKASQKASETLYAANKTAANIINSKTAEIYTRNYNGMGVDLQKGLKLYDFKPIKAYEAERYGNLTSQTVEKSKDEKWNEKNIASAVVAGALMLWGIEKIIRHSSALTARKNYDGSKRQASDTLTDAETKGRLDSMWRAYDEGFKNVQKEWVCTFDNRTRDTHIEYNDLGAVALDYEYSTGLSRPRDPSCEDLADVCNCRCTLVTKFGFAKGGTRSARWYDDEKSAGRSGVENLVSGSYKEPSSFKHTKTETISEMSYEEWMKWRKEA